MSESLREKLMTQLRHCARIMHGGRHSHHSHHHFHHHGRGPGRGCSHERGAHPHDGHPGHPGHPGEGCPGHPRKGCPGHPGEGAGPHGHSHGAMRGRHHGPMHGQGRILYHLAAMNGASQKALLDILDIRPASLSEAIDRMEGAGLVERRQSEEDRRVTNIFLTEAGRKAAEEIREMRDSRRDSMFSAFDEGELEQLSSLLDKLLEGYGNTPGEGHERCRGHRGRHGRHEGCACGHERHGGKDHRHGCSCHGEKPEAHGRPSFRPED